MRLVMGKPIVMAIVLSFIGTCFLFWAQSEKGFGRGDEGFLWYGVQRVMQGEVPIRDFDAYDPGRYYLSAGLMALMHSDGVLSLRTTQYLIQFLAVALALWIVASQGRQPGIVMLVLAAVIFFVWMIPRHKFYDIYISIIYVFLLPKLLRQPSRRQYFITGIVVGVIAFFGRNHALYGFLAAFACMIWLRVVEREGLPLTSATIWYFSGMAVGGSPLLGMMLIPGFAEAYWKSILYIFKLKSTNITLPLPWPWALDFKSLSFDAALRASLVGIYFMAIVLYGFVTILYCLIYRKKTDQSRPVLVSTSILSLVYAHYVFSRADIEHLTHSIFPMLIGLLVFFTSRRPFVKWMASSLLCATSFFVACIYHPGWQYLVAGDWVTVTMDNDHVIVDSRTARQWRLLEQLVSRYAANGESFLSVPFWPGAYPALSRKSPMWDIYATRPRSITSQEHEITRIHNAAPRFVFLCDYCLDGREELCFRNTNPLIYQYIEKNFKQIQSELAPDYLVFVW